MGSQAFQLADAASLLILIERLGFDVDPRTLVAAVRARIAKDPTLDGAELRCYWYEQQRDKDAPLELVAADRNGHDADELFEKFRTPRGYRAELWRTGGGKALSLIVQAPRFRRRPATVEVVCLNCGETWTRGDVDSSANHRRVHKQLMPFLAPTPHPKLIAARMDDPEPDLVRSTSPAWKHREIYERAVLFRRQFRYDWVQWRSATGDPDPNVHGFLLDLPDGRIVGACAFRWEPSEAAGLWVLDWVWIAPRYRRSGVLAQRWSSFRERFGDFRVGSPVSDAMQMFLAKHGDSHLMARRREKKWK